MKFKFKNAVLPCNEKEDFTTNDPSVDIICRIYLAEAPEKRYEKIAKELDKENYRPDCFFIEAIALKKKFIALMKDNYLDLPSHMSFVNLTNGALRIDYEASDSIVSFVYNPTNDSIMCDFEDYVRLVFNDTGSVEDSEFFIRLAIIPAKTVSVFLKKKAGALSSWKENEK